MYHDTEMIPRTLEEQIASFMDYMVLEKRCSEQTGRVYKIHLDRIRHFGVLPNQRQLSSVVQELSKQRKSAATIRLFIAVMKSFYTHLVRVRSIVENPTIFLNPPKQPKKVPRYLSETEVQQILDHLDKKGVDFVLDTIALWIHRIERNSCRGTWAEPRIDEEGTKMRNSVAGMPMLPLDVSGMSQRVLNAFTDEELDVAVSQLTDRLTDSYRHLGATTTTDMYHRALLVALRSEQMKRREKRPHRSLLLSDVPPNASIFELYGDVG